MFDVVLNTPLFLVILKVCAAVFIKEEAVCLVFILVENSYFFSTYNVRNIFTLQKINILSLVS